MKIICIGFIAKEEVSSHKSINMHKMAENLNGKFYVIVKTVQFKLCFSYLNGFISNPW